jgi:hypothetical protein
MKKHSQQGEALAHLKQLISLGAEFPDAVWNTTKAFELNAIDVEILELNYDNDCVNSSRTAGAI